jgi:hypothetical protein
MAMTARQPVAAPPCADEFAHAELMKISKAEVID